MWMILDGAPIKNANGESLFIVGMRRRVTFLPAAAFGAITMLDVAEMEERCTTAPVAGTTKPDLDETGSRVSGDT
jgi:hypothetical protein